MGKRKTTSAIKGNKLQSNGNNVSINNYPPPSVPIQHPPIFDILQSKDAEIKKLENMINILQERVRMQSNELERLRGHISKKDEYIDNLIFKQAG